MSYNRLNWVEGETPLSAQNFNNIEDGVEEALNGLEALGTRADLFNAIYPVGSIYMSVNNTNPSALFGGTWVAWGSGRVPVGVNTSDSSFNTVEKTGGAASHSYTPSGTNSGGAVQNHTLTVAEIPSHTHQYTLGSRARVSTQIESLFGTAYTFPAPEIATGATGGGGSHNHGFTQPTFSGTPATMSHLQPYITCYMWKRTA